MNGVMSVMSVIYLMEQGWVVRMDIRREFEPKLLDVFFLSRLTAMEARTSREIDRALRFQSEEAAEAARERWEILEAMEALSQ
jgi:hypothetical protein